MPIIITTTDEAGEHRGTPLELRDAVLAVDKDADVGIVKGNPSGIKVNEAAAVKYLLTLYTAKGNRRGETSNG